MHVSTPRHHQAEPELKTELWSCRAALRHQFPRRQGRKPLMINQEMPGFYDLISLGDLERFSRQRVFRRHVITTPEAAACRWPPTSLTELAHRLVHGGSMRIRSLDQFPGPAEPVIRLVRDIERKIAHPLASPAYVCSGAVADPTDNSSFHLQLSEGKKTWRLFGHVSAPGIQRICPGTSGNRPPRYHLSAGDMLFCRGRLDTRRRSRDSLSISLTLVFEPYRGSVLELLRMRGFPFRLLF
jgi:hypothetical protein